MMEEDDKRAKEMARKFDKKMMATNSSYDFEALLTKVSGFPNIV